MPAKEQQSTLVAPKARAGHGKGACSICQLPLDLLQRLNAAIWDTNRARVKGYRAVGVNFLVQEGIVKDVRQITTHALHTEQSWRMVDANHPATNKERPVFPTDFVSVSEKATLLGMEAMEQLEQNVRSGLVEPRDLINVARLGLVATTERTKLDRADKRPQLTIQAMFGIVSGHADTPDGEIKNVTPLIELRGELEAERSQLRIAAGYDDVDADDLASVL